MRHISGRDLRAGVVLAPHDIELELVAIVEQLEAGTATLTRLLEEQEQVDTDLELAMAQMMLRSGQRSADMRKAEALDVCAEQVRRSRKLAAQVRLVRDTQHNLRAELEAVRSIGASVRSSMWTGQGEGGKQQGVDAGGGRPLEWTSQHDPSLPIGACSCHHPPPLPSTPSASGS